MCPKEAPQVRSACVFSAPQGEGRGEDTCWPDHFVPRAEEEGLAPLQARQGGKTQIWVYRVGSWRRPDTTVWLPGAPLLALVSIWCPVLRVAGRSEDTGRGLCRAVMTSLGPHKCPRWWGSESQVQSPRKVSSWRRFECRQVMSPKGELRVKSRSHRCPCTAGQWEHGNGASEAEGGWEWGALPTLELLQPLLAQASSLHLP